MNHSHLMAISNCVDEYLDVMPESSEAIPNLLLSQPLPLADLVIQLSACHVVEDEDDAVLFLIDLVNIHDAGMIQPYQHFQLMARLYQEGFVDLSCKHLSGIPPYDSPNCGLSAVQYKMVNTAKYFLQLVVLIELLKSHYQPYYLVMLSEQLIGQLDFLSRLEMDTFTKVINYAINFILNHENQMKINQFIEIEEAEGDRITAIVLAAIKSLVQYQTNANDLANHLKLIRVDKERREYLQEKIQGSLQELRKAIFGEQLANISKLRSVEWRFEVEIASKNYRNDYQPNVVMNFKVQEGGRVVNNLVNSDFSNLKNLQNQLVSAMKLHGSARFKSARNSSV